MSDAPQPYDRKTTGLSTAEILAADERPWPGRPEPVKGTCPTCGRSKTVNEQRAEVGLPPVSPVATFASRYHDDWRPEALRSGSIG